MQGCSNYQLTSLLSAALPPGLAESLRLSGQSGTLRPPPRRLEGGAFQPARRRLFGSGVLRKGKAFPQDRRRSRSSSPTVTSVTRISLGAAYCERASHYFALSARAGRKRANARTQALGPLALT
jgi:hypothetical protein